MSSAYKFCPQCSASLELDRSGERPRMTCPACGFVHWNNPVPVVAALVQQANGEVVLVHHKQWPEKTLGLVTGFLEAGEAPDQAVLREVEEELGLRGSVAGLIGLYSVAPLNQLILAYHVLVDGEIRLGDELDRYKQVPVASVKPWPFGTGLAVADWLRQQSTQDQPSAQGQPSARGE